jgi:glucose/arabinose dehydrogenase
MRRSAPVALALLLLAACGGDDGGGEAVPDATTTTAVVTPEAEDLTLIELGSVLVAELEQPIALAARAGTDDLYVAEKTGAVRRIEVTPVDADTDDDDTSNRALPTYEVASRPVIDLTGEVAGGGEQGLLGLAFSSDGRRLYVDYTRRSDGATVVEEISLGDATTADAADRRALLIVEQPAENHNGGQLVLGPDGYLYVGLGDGGGGGDPDDNGQDPDALLGSILRIDPDGGDSSAEPRPGSSDGAYAIPGGNPFQRDGQPTEVWLYGVRNPWRFTFDRATGDLWVADVGQGEWEEIDLLPATNGKDAGRGANLGWNEMEGNHAFDGGENPVGGVLPVFEYSHAEGGCSVTGGYRYRGAAIPALAGTYLFADYCLDGVRGLQVDEAGRAITGQHAWDLPSSQLQSFGEDADGELYLLLAGGEVRRIVAGGASG